MQFLSTLCTIVAVLSAILLIVIILMQDNKSGGGLGGLVGGSENMFGGETASVLVQITTWLAVIFLVATIAKASILSRSRTTASDSIYANMEVEEAATPASEEAVAPVSEEVAE